MKTLYEPKRIDGAFEGGEKVSNSSYAWWKKEDYSEELLRKIACKAERLGRLPTEEEIQSDSSLPSLFTIATFYKGRSVASLLRTLAGLLYKRGTHPLDLTAEERALPDAERAKIEQEYWNFYQERIERIKQPGGVSRLRKEQREAQMKKDLPPGVVVKQIPISSRRKFSEESAEEAEMRRRQWNDFGWGETSSNRKRVQKGVKRVSRKMVSDEAILKAIETAKAYFGDYPSQWQLTQYRKTHQDEHLPSWTAVVRLLGADRALWPEKIAAIMAAKSIAVFKVCEAQTAELLNAEGISENSDAADVETTGTIVNHDESDMTADTTEDNIEQDLEVDPQEDVEADSRGHNAAAVPIKLKINLKNLKLNFQMDGQDYELTIEFGASE